MALAGRIGILIEGEWFDGHAAARLFGEDQGRYLLATTDAEALAEAAEEAGLDIAFLGRTGGDAIADDDGSLSVPLDALRSAHEGFFPRLMGKELAVA